MEVDFDDDVRSVLPSSGSKRTDLGDTVSGAEGAGGCGTGGAVKPLLAALLAPKCGSVGARALSGASAGAFGTSPPNAGNSECVGVLLLREALQALLGSRKLALGTLALCGIPAPRSWLLAVSAGNAGRVNLRLSWRTARCTAAVLERDLSEVCGESSVARVTLHTSSSASHCKVLRSETLGDAKGGNALWVEPNRAMPAGLARVSLQEALSVTPAGLAMTSPRLATGGHVRIPKLSMRNSITCAEGDARRSATRQGGLVEPPQCQATNACPKT